MKSQLHTLSIRARAAFAILCLEEALKKYDHDAQWNRVLPMLWSITDIEHVDEWLYQVSRIMPSDVLEQPYEENAVISRNDHDALRPLYTKTSQSIHDILELIFECGSVGLYGVVVENSPKTLAVLRELVALMKRESIPLPNINLVLEFSIDEHGGWGRRFKRDELFFNTAPEANTTHEELLADLADDPRPGETITEFELCTKDGLFFSPTLHGGSLFGNVDEATHLRYVNTLEAGIAWTHNGKKIVLLEEGVHIFGLPTPDMTRVVAIYGGATKRYAAPQNAVIYNADGSVHQRLPKPVLKSELGVEKKRVVGDFVWYDHVALQSGYHNTMKMVVTIGFGDWYEKRELDPETGVLEEVREAGRS
ncbi:MAG: hypothetical protein ACOYXT_08455 [Bacteroidota bacterium]